MNHPKLQYILDQLRGVKSSGSSNIAFCPAHNDKNERSFSITLKGDHILVHCFAGCSYEQIKEALALTDADFFTTDKPASDDIDRLLGPLTVEDLAIAKGLPVEFLNSLGVISTPDGVGIPYFRRDKSPCPRQRIRKKLSGENKTLWIGTEGVPIEAYGQWRLDEAQQAGYLILVEGESDCWTLWHHGFPALGIPGNTAAKTLVAAHLESIKRLYLVQEADKGGKTFVEHMARRLQELSWQGETFVIPMPL